MRPTHLFGTAITALVVCASASAESLQSPSQLRTHSLFSEVSYSAFQEKTLKSFLNASLGSESVSSTIQDTGDFAALQTSTRGSAYETLDRIRIEFANNLDSEVMAKTSVRFSLAQEATVSLGGLLPGGSDFIGEDLIEIRKKRDSTVIGTFTGVGQAISLEADVTYDLSIDLRRNTFTQGTWGSWVFDIEYAQSVPVPSPAGLAILVGSCLARRRRR